MHKAVMPTILVVHWLLPMNAHFLNSPRPPYSSSNTASWAHSARQASCLQLSGLPNPANLASPSFGPWLVILVRIRPPKRPATTTPLINLKHSSAQLEVPRMMRLAMIVLWRLGPARTPLQQPRGSSKARSGYDGAVPVPQRAHRRTPLRIPSPFKGGQRYYTVFMPIRYLHATGTVLISVLLLAISSFIRGILPVA
ncbi:hypothetical protein LI328DRAFT_171900 [Trichoderma asperelloides]|nr:hypothetical protein LI328DRAFT_171900 [Trichoderma asperelloides]